MHSEPGCDLYSLHEADGTFVFVEQWADADALKTSDQISAQIRRLMSGAQGQENNGGLIPMAMLSSMFGRMMPDALEKLKEEAPKATSRGNGQ